MQELKDKVTQALKEQTLDGLLCLKSSGGYILPCIVTSDNIADLDSMVIGDERYPIATILSAIVAKQPGKTIGVVVRGCEEKAIIELIKSNQVDANRIVQYGVACSKERAQLCSCEVPYPSEILAGTKVEGVSDNQLLSKIEAMPSKDRLSFWMDQLGKCIKCYGCRNICPVCFCEDCAMEHDDLVPTGVVPPSIPSFHLIKAVHMAGKCIDCGFCEQVCPMNIPIRTIYRKMGLVMKEVFDYEPGLSIDERSPLGELEKGLEAVAEK